SRRSTASSRRSTSTATTRPPRCPREPRPLQTCPRDCPWDMSPRATAEGLSPGHDSKRHGRGTVPGTRVSRKRGGMSTPGPERVPLTIDDREVTVPKGTGMVETAQAAGIKIPVFCYEPRLGPAVGACRMCLVEVEGMPKLQAGCTLTAQDGMVVKTAQS